MHVESNLPGFAFFSRAYHDCCFGKCGDSDVKIKWRAAQKRVGQPRLCDMSSLRFMSLLQAAEEIDEDELILRDPEERS